MPLNFRLTYKESTNEYVELMPHTRIEDIQNSEDILKYSTIVLDIPKYNGLIQTIPYNLNDKQSSAPFIVELSSSGIDAQIAYSLIDQIEAGPTGFTVVRLGEKSDVPIQVKIIFKEAGV